MIHNEEVKNYCENFDKIVNYQYDKEDVITDKLITIYQKFVSSVNLNDNANVSLVMDFDHVLLKYIDDFLFRKELKKEIVRIKIRRSCTDVLKEIVVNILNIFNNYLFNTTRKVEIARWI